MSHYFENSTSPQGNRREGEVTVWGTTRTYLTAGGVFSGSGLDKATAILLTESQPPPPGSVVLDLGCGWGPISCSLAATGATVWAVDVNERALELTAENAGDLPVMTALPADVPAELRFDEIWSNPPIRIGKDALHEMLSTWLPRLRPGGLAWLVVGKNLGADSLQSWLNTEGWQADRIGSAKGFRVFRVERT